ncbi:hypothetical protein N656DRAFT_784123 [Canariomyces notabilis]|uniref:Uncharacterized protein n=1 Tax=Canariomyces notabilis TaxID=2074819 RepID=A0AAN6T8V7_9PEZI|nr:hypothetical protein N656DRAFT_784123 [Canariomyces arenarius]
MEPLQMFENLTDDYMIPGSGSAQHSAQMPAPVMDFGCSNCKSLDSLAFKIDNLSLKIETLLHELIRNSRLERRLDRLDRDQERDGRLETVKKDITRISEISGKILESTNTLAADLKSFSMDVTRTFQGRDTI